MDLIEYNNKNSVQWDNTVKNCFVYAHYKKDNNEIFYIGIGTHKFGNTKYQIYKRAYDKHISSRNELWYRCYKKHGLKVEIIYDNLTEKEAKEKEIFLISFYGRKIIKTGTLCNISGGGEGRFLDNSNNKRIHVYTLSGEYIKSFDSCNEAASYYNLDRRNIGLAANMKRHTCGNLQFRYDYNKNLEIKNLCKTPRKVAIPIIACKEEETKEFSSIYKFTKFLGIKSNSHILECLNGSRKYIMGWAVRYKGV